jgi:hypothetical protein
MVDESCPSTTSGRAGRARQCFLVLSGHARAAARSGDVEASRSAYEALRRVWQNADSNIPIVRAARREYGQLGVSLTADGESPKKKP